MNTSFVQHVTSQQELTHTGPFPHILTFPDTKPHCCSAYLPLLLICWLMSLFAKHPHPQNQASCPCPYCSTQAVTMKFGKYLDTHRRVQWADNYLDYSLLKHTLKEVRLGQRNVVVAWVRGMLCVQLVLCWWPPESQHLVRSWSKLLLQSRLTSTKHTTLGTALLCTPEQTCLHVRHGNCYDSSATMSRPNLEVEPHLSDRQADVAHGCKDSQLSHK